MIMQTCANVCVCVYISENMQVQ